MIYLTTEQLNVHLKKKLYSCYILFGNDSFLIQESKIKIFNQANINKFYDRFNIYLDIDTNWDTIFNLLKTYSLFNNRKILLLIFPEKNILPIIEEKLCQLISLLHQDILLILQNNSTFSSFQNSHWFKMLYVNTILVNCTSPKQEKLIIWIKKYSKNIGLTLDEKIYTILAEYYKNNLINLIPLLQYFSYINLNHSITFSQVQNYIDNVTFFTVYHLINSILLGDISRATYILQQLYIENIDYTIILRSIQREVLDLLIFKKKIKITPIKNLSDHYTIYQNKKNLLEIAGNRLSNSQLQQIIVLMIQIEKNIKHNYNDQVQSYFQMLIILLCGKKLPIQILYDE